MGIEMKRFALFLFVSAVLLYGHQAAAGKSISAAEIMSHPEIQNALLDTAKKSPFVRARKCTASQLTPSNNFVTLSPKGYVPLIVKQPIKWKGCGQERTLNILMAIDVKKMLSRTTSLAPGDTHASPTLQKDAGMAAMPMVVASTGLKDCKSFYIDNTKFLKQTGQPAKKALGSSWDERWTISVCERKVSVIMHFTPDATGTSFSAQLEKPK